jgi:UDP-N-acetylmuramate dehydrogenase
MKFTLKKLLPGIRENISLKNFNTFKIGGKARYFFVATKKEDLIKSVNLANDFKLPFFVLGNGSNLLISDKGFNGLVIKIKNQKSKIKHNLIYTEAGVPLGQLVALALKNNLTGLEWAIGIPGTLGGAIYGNAGAFGKSMSNIIKEVEVYDVKNKEIKIFKIKNCKFSYRESIFKSNKNLIIISAKLRLKKGNKEKIKQKMRAYLNYRIETQPLKFPSIGSIFKNPAPERSSVRGRSINFSSGELIEKCGLKGKKMGDVKISEKHANFIINLGKGKARDVVKLINLIKKKVKEKLGVNLEEEIIYLGFKIRG